MWGLLLLAVLALARPASAQVCTTIASPQLVVTGGSVYVVRVDGDSLSAHTSLWAAAARAIQARLLAPHTTVWIDPPAGRIRVEGCFPVVRPDTAVTPPSVPPPAPPPPVTPPPPSPIAVILTTAVVGTALEVSASWPSLGPDSVYVSVIGGIPLLSRVFTLPPGTTSRRWEIPWTVSTVPGPATWATRVCVAPLPEARLGSVSCAEDVRVIP